MYEPQDAGTFYPPWVKETDATTKEDVNDLETIESAETNKLSKFLTCLGASALGYAALNSVVEKLPDSPPVVTVLGVISAVIGYSQLHCPAENELAVVDEVTTEQLEASL